MTGSSKILLVLVLLIAVWELCADLLPDTSRRDMNSLVTDESNAPEVTQDFLDNIEMRLLHMFGLHRRPRPKSKPVIPDYILQIYKAQMENVDDVSMFFNVKDKTAHASNTIRSFFGKH